MGNRPEFGRQAKEHQQHIQRHHTGHAISAGHFGACQLAVFFVIACDLANSKLHLVRVAKRLHFGDAGRRCLEAVAAVNQNHAFGLVRPFGDKIQRPIQRGVAAADDHQVFPGKVGRIPDAVKQLAVVKLFQSIDAQQFGLESAHAGGDEDCFCQEPGAFGGFDKKAAIFPLFDDADFLAVVKGRAERVNLLEQVVGQFLAGIDRNGWNVVNRLVGIKLDALAARIGQRVDDMRLDFQQPEFKHLKQTHRPGADDDGIGFDGAVMPGGGVDHFLVQLKFHVFCFDLFKRL